MKVKELMSFLDSRYDPSVAASWDNPGLICGDKEAEISKVFITLDVTEEALERAVLAGADMIVTHHPMIFSPIKKVTNGDIFGRRIIKMIKNDISYFAIHTNYDIMRMSELNAEDAGVVIDEVLSVTGTDEEGKDYGFGFVGNISETKSLEDFAKDLKVKYHLSHIRVYGDCKQQVKRVAMCSGSGKDFIDDAIAKGADTYICGDVDHHSAIDAVMKGISVIDGCHYGTELCFINDLAKVIKNAYPDLEVIKDEIKAPFTII